MKKIFPLIVVLITLSVVGILFIQMSWINNAIKLKHEEFLREVDQAMKNTTEELQGAFLQKENAIFPNLQSKQYFIDNNFTIQYFTKDDVALIINNELRANKIKQPYEFSVNNIFGNPVISSEGFNVQEQNNSFHTLLVPKAMNPETLYLYIKEDKSTVLRQMGWMIAASILFTSIIILAFSVTVRTLFNQKKLSEVKSDFINNMTHELKTPLATISLAIDALTNDKVIHDTDKIRYYSGMIKEENKRMNKQVEKILQAAKIERQDIKLSLQKLDAHQLINKVADNLTLQIQEKNGTLNLKLNAKQHEIEADEVHFSNIIFNLLDNAIKYSRDPMHIEVETLSNREGLTIKVKDNGIGMNKETQARIFEKFYRAHTGNLHNVKGFGLGLSYVKAIVDAHNGKIKVESTAGKGSTFTVTMPFSI